MDWMNFTPAIGLALFAIKNKCLGTNEDGQKLNKMEGFFSLFYVGIDLIIATAISAAFFFIFSCYCEEVTMYAKLPLTIYCFLLIVKYSAILVLSIFLMKSSYVKKLKTRWNFKTEIIMLMIGFLCLFDLSYIIMSISRIIG